MTIWKFPLLLTDGQAVFMPADAQLLTVAVQHGVPCLWAIVDPAKAQVGRSIFCVGTGNPMPTLGNPRYLGTTQHEDGRLVFHWFSTH